MQDKKSRLLHWYIEHRFPIFPCHWVRNGLCSCGKAACSSPGKHPLVEHGFHAATTDSAQIQEWHERWPDANWAMRTGDHASGGAGLLVIDIDPRHGGDARWDMLREENPEPVETVTVQTGGGGQHYWFNYPNGFEISSKANCMGAGIDCKALGGYVLVPPSRTSGAYSFLLNPDQADLQELPDWILARLEQPESNPPIPISERLGETIPIGERHNSLVALGAALRQKGMLADEIRAALLTVRDQRLEDSDSISEAEVEAIVDWIAMKAPDYSPSDLGNAERFVNQNGEKVQFCYAWNRWLVWNGKRWAVDESGEVIKLAHDTIKAIYAEASNCNDEKRRKSLTKHALISEGRHRVESMLESAKPYLSISANQLDQHPMLLNCLNGVIDLETGNLLPHDRKYLLTKMIEVDFDAHALCPGWERFLKLITGEDENLELFLQLAVGYTLTGRTDEHCLFFLFGTGKNGKSTFTETLRRLFGDYSQRTDIEALMQNYTGRGGAASPYIAALAGARFVLASEMPEGRRLNESLIKDLTGGDAITARNLFSNPFTFPPTHKFWIFGNHKPKVSGTDEGFWRRMRLIPFKVTIPDDVRRPMSEVMAEFEAELPGILAWAVTGSVLWQNNKLQMPDAVEQATKTYRSEQDLAQQFIDECCETHPDYRVSKDELYKAWKAWCENAGEEGARSRSKKWLTQQLTNRDFAQGGNGNSLMMGVKLKGSK